ncbi:site-2 protease family protein, partial [Candidatus Sumerlaeota bacterium]|nr:site-2 protease family protein [Candidatus Sumerlaeota bacterium]
IYETWSIAEPVHYLFFSLVWINVFWVFFNLVPIYPLDGGQFLFHFLAQWWGDTRAMLTVARISLPLCAVIGVIGMREGFMILPIMCLNFFITNMKTVQELR